MNRRSSPLRTCSLVFLALALTTLPAPAGAYFQKTTVEGTIGRDIGGVWLSVQHLMPMFRVRLDRGQDRVAPFDVGPIGKDLALLFGGDPAGVVITKMADPTISASLGIFEGDVITKINTIPVVDVESYEKALGTVDKWFLVTIKRSGLAYTAARIVKIEYSAREGELEDGTTGVAEETIQFQYLDVMLPFAAALEKTRQSHDLFVPDDKQIATLKTDWWKLPEPARSTFVNGEHRFVAEHNYDQPLRQDENLDGTTFAVLSTLQGNPATGNAGKTITVYGIRRASADEISGTYVETTFAQAPFPISIEFSGSFTFTRLDDFSNKDLEHRSQQAKAVKKELENEDVDLAPEVPANLPAKEENPPAVAE
jgi:hypothetical protein